MSICDKLTRGTESNEPYTMQDVAAQLECFEEFQCGMTEYKVVEQYHKANSNTYNLYNLRADIEDGAAYFYDAEGELERSNSVLRFLVLSLILGIEFIWIQKCMIVIHLLDCDITIEPTIQACM